MKYSQQKKGGRTSAILAGTYAAEEAVPTVFFDLSDYAAGAELPLPSQSTSIGRISAPSVEEHYGALLQREEQAHQRTEEKLRLVQEQMRRMQDEIRQRELEFEEVPKQDDASCGQEKRELMDMIDEKDYRSLTDDGVAMGEVCPLVPIMPDKFDFEREIFTFWATETVWNGPSFFCKIEQRPSFFGKGQRLCWETSQEELAGEPS
eukprot:Skav222246  [mRNA]  locus=scaffold3059:209979:214785:- [translate_table: standard]